MCVCVLDGWMDGWIERESFEGISMGVDNTHI